METFIKRFLVLTIAAIGCFAVSVQAQDQPKYYLQSAVAGKYLDVQWSNPNLGAPVHLWDYNGRSAQKWTLIPAGDYFFIRSEFGTYLDVQWSIPDPGTPAHLWEFNGGDGQKWKLIPMGGGFYLIQSKLGTYLDVRWGASDSGTPIWMWSYNAGNAQRWRLSAVPGSNTSTSGVGVAIAALAAASGAKWPEKVINVCWENPSSSTQVEQGLVRQAVADSWEAASAVRFYGWGQCTGYEDGIRIKIADEGPHVKALGAALRGLRDGMVLNFTFRNWCPLCVGSRREHHIKTIAIHEFGHALGFSHEHNRSDCYFGDCADAPQGQSGDWNITECDSASIMNYCFNSGYNGRLSYWDIQGVRAMYGSVDYGASEVREFRPQTIGYLCPTAVLGGDREFGGNGPRIHTEVRLRITEDRQHLEAVIDFHAVEAGGDRSATARQWVRRIWSAEPGKQITGILSNRFSEANFMSSGAGGEFLACGDGHIHNPPVDGGKLVRSFHIIGDTGGTDISSDEDCHCDTQIRAIEFNTVKIIVAPRS